MKIKTERLIIRSIQEVDLEPLAALWTDPEVTYYMGGPRNYEGILEDLREDAQLDPQPAFDLWPVIEKETGQIIGHCGILEKTLRAGINMRLYMFWLNQLGVGDLLLKQLAP